jgi:ABC-type cobalamin/Fe3+-siderophores transport system ATPase subunit
MAEAVLHGVVHPISQHRTGHLVCRGLNLGYGRRRLVRDLDLDLHPGELLAVTGSSGCGKSSLLRILAGLDRPHSGTVTLHGHRRGAVAVAFQDSGLPGAINGLQAILAGRLHALPWWRGWLTLPDTEAFHARTRAMDLGVGHLLDRPVATASGGERQRLAVARALHHGGRIVLLDEPVSQLDQDSGRLVMDRLRAEATAAGRAVLAVVHQSALVEACADRELAIGVDGAWSLRKVER